MLILLSRPENLQDLLGRDIIEKETGLMQSMLSQGMDRVHLRKPMGDLKDLEILVEAIGHSFKEQISIHPPSDLFSFLKCKPQTMDMEMRILKSLNQITEWMQHLGLRYLHLPAWLRTRLSIEQQKMLEDLGFRLGFKYSTGVHSLEELEALQLGKQWLFYDYIFISPLLDSITKQGYDKNKKLWKINRRPVYLSRDRTKFIGLGGIDCNSIANVKKAGFDGVGLLGGIWGKEVKLIDTHPKNLLENYYKCIEKWKAA